MRTHDALVIGESLIDLVTDARGVTVEHAGGSAANVAVALARLGRPVRFATAYGDDERGRLIDQRLTSSGVALEGDPRILPHTSTASATIVCRRSWRKRSACSAERMSGWVTISTSGVPARLKSISERSAPIFRPVPPPTWTVFAASSSRCARTNPISNAGSPGTSSRPPTQSGWSYWEIW